MRYSPRSARGSARASRSRTTSSRSCARRTRSASRLRRRWRTCGTWSVAAGSARSTGSRRGGRSRPRSGRRLARRAVALEGLRRIPAVRLEVALEDAGTLLGENVEAHRIHQQEELRVPRARHDERAGERMRFAHVRDALGSAELADDATRLDRVVEAGDRLESAWLLGELDDLRRIVDVDRGSERVEVEVLGPELAIHRRERLGQADHRVNMLREVAVRRDGHRRMERDPLDVAPGGVAVEHVAPNVERELPQALVGDRANAGEDLEEVLGGQHGADYAVAAT